jgi:hypothetical protein
VNAGAKLAGFAAILAALCGGGALAGGLIDPSAPGGNADAQARATGHQATKTNVMKNMDATSATTHADAGGRPASGNHGAMNMTVRGLAVAENGLRVIIDDPELRRGTTQQLRFRIVDEQGHAVRDFDIEHTKRMHLIVARRDLTGFQHLHPTMASDGTWSTPLRLADAGSYRLFADFAHEGKPTTLAGDLRVDGTVDLQPLPAPASAARSDGGYDVRLDSAAGRAGKESALRFTITKDGQPVHVEPYLGAGGHLVALREGDLAFLHVHPTDHGHGDAAAAGGDDKPAGRHDNSIGFAATFPTAGQYRLFLQFKHAGQVQTVAYTQEVR